MTPCGKSGPEVSDTPMRQCELTRTLACGVAFHVAWIPEKFAVLGKMLRLRINGEWIDHYRVTRVYSRQGYRSCNERSRDYRRHRQHSDRLRKPK